MLRTFILAALCGPVSLSNWGPTDFAISPQPAGAALAEFSSQSGLEFIAPAELVAGRTSLGVRGRMTPEAALAEVLRCSGLVGRVEAGQIWLAEAAPGEDACAYAATQTPAHLV